MNNSKKLALYTSRGAIVATLYVVLTTLASLAGLSSGVIQFRISEALCILPIFLPEAVPGLFIGCLLSNLLVPGVAIWDIIFGSIATLIGAIGARLMRNLPEKYKWSATLPTILANMIIVPLVLIYAYGLDEGMDNAYIFFMLTVGLGEVVCAGVGGSALYYVLNKYKKQWLKRP